MTACRILFTVAIVAHTSLVLAQTKAPVPDPQAQAKAMAMVKEIFKAEYDAAKTAPQKEELAKKLLDLARETKALPDRYAILRVAGALSMEAGGPICFQAVDEMEKSFQIDGLNMKAKVLPHCAANATATQSKAIAQTGIALVRGALAKDRHDLARQVIGPTSSAARKSKDVALVKQAGDLAKKIDAAAKAYAAVKAAEAALDANAADPAANLTVGKYHCFFKGDWDKGLSMLALSSDPTIKALAEKELRGVTAANDQVALADGWWALAETEGDAAKEQIRRHAAGWYKSALPQLTGLKKMRVEKRVREVSAVGAVATTARPSQIPQTPKTPKLSEELSIDVGGGVEMEFVLIPGGEFVMGSSGAKRQLAMEQAKAHNNKLAIDRIPSEGPQHKVKITKPFYLGKYEVTQTQWQAVMGDNPSQFKGPTNPVEKVSWDDIQPFLVKMNVAFEAKGMVFGLPTEAGWEYACRAGTTTAFSFGDNPALLGQHGWFKDNSGKKPHPVGQGKPNAWGLYDMHGNVWEWCSDWHAKDYYSKSPPVDPVGPPTGSARVHRGGSWRNHPERCRSAFRNNHSPGHRYDTLGLRLALVRSVK